MRSGCFNSVWKSRTSTDAHESIIFDRNICYWVIDYVRLKFSLHELWLCLMLFHIERRILKLGWRYDISWLCSKTDGSVCFRMRWILCWLWTLSTSLHFDRAPISISRVYDFRRACPFHGGVVADVSTRAAESGSRPELGSVGVDRFWSESELESVKFFRL